MYFLSLACGVLQCVMQCVMQCVLQCVLQCVAEQAIGSCVFVCVCVCLRLRVHICELGCMSAPIYVHVFVCCSVLKCVEECHS